MFMTDSISLIESSSEALRDNSRNNAPLIAKIRTVSQELDNLANRIHLDRASKSF